MENISFLLQPFAWLFGIVVRLRHSLYRWGILKSYRSTLRVICVGNIIAGGSGKTPFVHFLSKLLSENVSPNNKVAILSRGYGGSHHRATLVSKQHTTEEVGDEAYLHFQKNVSDSVVIAKKRAAGVKLIEAKKLANTVLLDDGYQHFALERDINLLLLDCSNEKAVSTWSENRLLPAGLQRETLKSGTQRANAIILVDKRCDTTSARSLEKAQTILKTSSKTLPTTFSFRLEPTKLLELHSGEEFGLEILSELQCSMLTAIANPNSFQTLLEKHGARLENRVYVFADHHQFTDSEISKAFTQSLPLLTTEKDAVKLAGRIPKTEKCYVLQLEGSLGAQQADFISFLNHFDT